MPLRFGRSPPTPPDASKRPRRRAPYSDIRGINGIRLEPTDSLAPPPGLGMRSSLWRALCLIKARGGNHFGRLVPPRCDNEPRCLAGAPPIATYLTWSAHTRIPAHAC